MDPERRFRVAGGGLRLADPDPADAADLTNIVVQHLDAVDPQFPTPTPAQLAAMAEAAAELRAEH